MKKAWVKFAVGDTVLLAREPELFWKGYEPTWQPQPYTIARVFSNRERPVYSLQDADGDRIQGRFYNEQLQKVVLHRP